MSTSEESDDRAVGSDTAETDAFISDPDAADRATRERMSEQAELERQAGHPVSSDPAEEIDPPKGPDDVAGGGIGSGSGSASGSGLGSGGATAADPDDLPAGSPDVSPSGVPSPEPGTREVPDVDPVPGVSPDPGSVPGDPTAPGNRLPPLI